MYLKHDSGDAAELRNRQVLGEDSPLQFDEDGYAEVDDVVGEKLLAMHRHVEHAGRGPTAGTTDASDEAFDAEAFIDRTPMETVIQDLETGAYDDHLDAVEAVAERQGVLDAVDDRRE